MTLRTRLSESDILLAPGIYDPLTAAIAEAAGFEALYLSCAAVSYTRLGRPDIGLATLSEMTETMALVRDRVKLPIIIDADTGFGNALSAQRTMRMYERAGANALQVEDQTFPKRCGHLLNKTLISASEMAGKISAMIEARASDETLVIARTDAISVEGFGAAIKRAETYLAAGADALFIEAPRDRLELIEISQHFKLIKFINPSKISIYNAIKKLIMSSDELQKLQGNSIKNTPFNLKNLISYHDNQRSKLISQK